MKMKKLLFVGFLAIGFNLSVNAQITNATQPDVIIGGVSVQNTGLAVAPNIDLHAAALDDGSNYKIFWIDGASGATIDADGNQGIDPDVAYFADETLLAVAYEIPGKIFIDEYKLVATGPFDYSMISTTFIDYGTYPNTDINSVGDGIVSWENGGVIWLCSYNLGSFTAGPPVPINQGTQADVVLLDDGITVALTYIDPSGNLVIETLDYSAIQVGGYTPWWQSVYGPMTAYEYPRIAGQRNQCCGPADDFTVVAQDFNGSTAEVHGFFGNGGTITNPMVPVNIDFLGCNTFNPLPVVVYDRDRIQIAWSQDYLGGCTSLSQSSPNQEDDVIVQSYDLFGNPIWPFYEEVNLNQSNFAGISKTSVATEYDGYGYIIDATFKFSVMYNDPGTSMWKTRNALVPNFSDQAAPTEDRGDNFSLVSNPVEQTIEILSESDEEATFQLLDNAGRIVDLNSVTNNGHQYTIDISHLSGGVYFLNCSSASGEEVLRILQVTH